MDILIQCVIVFFTQLSFVWLRTLNVRAVAIHNTTTVLITGAFVHITWLIGIAIGANSMYKIMNDFRLDYLPIILCSLTGGLLGSWFGMIKKEK
jgi:hypothetical protein